MEVKTETKRKIRRKGLHKGDEDPMQAEDQKERFS